jgi:hypothetical protein
VDNLPIYFLFIYLGVVPVLEKETGEIERHGRPASIPVFAIFLSHFFTAAVIAFREDLEPTVGI